jgi:DNA-binding NarL/FixJ family response regulator
MARIVTLIAAPRESALQQLRPQLHGQADVKLLTETPTDVDPIRLVRAWRPEVMLLDAGIEGIGAITTLDRAQAINPATRTLVFCATLTESFVVRALKHGARGCLRTGTSTPQVLSAIRAVHAGELWAARKTLADAFQKLLAVHLEPAHEHDGKQAELSARELQIVAWMRRGMTNKDIARELGISDTTVKTHAHNIFHKMKISGRVRLLQKLQYVRAPLGRRVSGKHPLPPAPSRSTTVAAVAGTVLAVAAAGLVSDEIL